MCDVRDLSNNKPVTTSRYFVITHQLAWWNQHTSLRMRNGKFVDEMRALIILPLAAPPCEMLLDICLIIDSSGSCRDKNPPDGSYDNWQLLLTFVSNLVDKFEVGRDQTRFGAVVFSDNARLVFPLNRYFTAEGVKSGLGSIAYIGQRTNTPEALRVTRQQCFHENNGDRPGVNNLAIIVTDGYPYPDSRKPETVTEAQLLRSSGVKMVAVGISNQIDENMLRQLSSMPQQRGRDYFTTADFVTLDEIRFNVTEESCRPGTLRHNCCKFDSFTISRLRLHVCLRSG